MHRFTNLRYDLDRLHQKSDQLAASSEYLVDEKNSPLRHDIEDFFAQLETLETEYSQTVPLLTNFFKSSDTKRGLERCEEFTQILLGKVKSLLLDTDVLTGVVSSYEPNAEITDATVAEVSKKTARDTELFILNRGPSWLYDAPKKKQSRKPGLHLTEQDSAKRREEHDAELIKLTESRDRVEVYPYAAEALNRSDVRGSGGDDEPMRKIDNE